MSSQGQNGGHASLVCISVRSSRPLRLAPGAPTRECTITAAALAAGDHSRATVPTGPGMSLGLGRTPTALPANVSRLPWSVVRTVSALEISMGRSSCGLGLGDMVVGGSRTTNG